MHDLIVIALCYSIVALFQGYCIARHARKTALPIQRDELGGLIKFCMFWPWFWFIEDGLRCF